jgi:hypothetical protein
MFFGFLERFRLALAARLLAPCLDAETAAGVRHEEDGCAPGARGCSVRLGTRSRIADQIDRVLESRGRGRRPALSSPSPRRERCSSCPSSRGLPAPADLFPRCPRPDLSIALCLPLPSPPSLPARPLGFLLPFFSFLSVFLLLFSLAQLSSLLLNLHPPSTPAPLASCFASTRRRPRLLSSLMMGGRGRRRRAGSFCSGKRCGGGRRFHGCVHPSEV